MGAMSRANARRSSRHANKRKAYVVAKRREINRGAKLLRHMKRCAADTATFKQAVSAFNKLEETVKRSAKRTLQQKYGINPDVVMVKLNA